MASVVPLLFLMYIEYTFLTWLKRGVSVNLFIAIHRNTHKITNFNQFFLREQIIRKFIIQQPSPCAGPIIRHTNQYPDAYWDVSYYVPPHQYTPAEIEMYLISPRPQFPPHEPPRPVREFLIVSNLDDWFEDILDEAEEEVFIEAIADPIAHRDIVTAFFNATNIQYPKKKKTSWIRRGVNFLRRAMAPLRRLWI